MNRKAKRDGNHKTMTKFLRDAGQWFRECGHFAGLGCDLICIHRDGFPVFIEVKPPGPPSSRKLTDSEDELRDVFPSFYRIVQTVEELRAAIGLG